MNNSNRDKLDPHLTGLWAGGVLALGAVLCGFIGAAILFFGNGSFDVVHYGLGIENKYLRIALLPLVAFAGGYAFAFSVCSILRMFYRK